MWSIKLCPLHIEQLALLESHTHCLSKRSRQVEEQMTAAEHKSLVLPDHHSNPLLPQLQTSSKFAVMVRSAIYTDYHHLLSVWVCMLCHSSTPPVMIERHFIHSKKAKSVWTVDKRFLSTRRSLVCLPKISLNYGFNFSPCRLWFVLTNCCPEEKSFYSYQLAQHTLKSPSPSFSWWVGLGPHPPATRRRHSLVHLVLDHIT